MNISEIKIDLSGNDLLSIINEFVKVDNLSINEIKIDEVIKVMGSFKQVVNIDFVAGIKINRVENGIISAEFSSFKVLKLGIISLLRKLAMKYAVKAFEEKGIYYNNGKILIDIKKLLIDVPYINFDISDIHIKKELLNVDVKNIEISIAGNLIKENIDEVVTEETEEVPSELELENIEKITDAYSLGREYLENKLPAKVKKFSDYVFVIPDIAALIYRLLKDDRVEMKTKLIISGAVAYIAFPIDIIPDNIPFIGRIDEMAVAFFALDRIVTDVPVKVVIENWEGKNDIILVIRNVIEYVTNFTGARNVDKLYNFLDEIISL